MILEVITKQVLGCLQNKSERKVCYETEFENTVHLDDGPIVLFDCVR